MRCVPWILTGALLASIYALEPPAKPIPPPPDDTWSVRAQIVEATTDDGLSPVYDRRRPGSATHRCRFMNAINILEGHVGRVRLNGMKIVLAGDLGQNLERTEMGSLAIVTDPLATDAQRKAAIILVHKIYPVRWARIVPATAPLTWVSKPTGYEIRAGGRGAMTVSMEADAAGTPVVRHGVNYWNASRTEDLRLARGTFFYRADGIDVKRANGGGFVTHIEAAGRTIPGDIATGQ